ncbi:MAG: GtrA family protein [Gulosibacter sp.]|uniref:GtrA family protein n=1 Tax=Gulosibacter sp. TaxID=2817531 RepID=UPI003F918E21
MTNNIEHSKWQDSPHPRSGALAVIAASHSESESRTGTRPRRGSWPWIKNFVAQLMKFGLVGGLGVVVDLGIYTLLRTSVLSPDVHEAGPIVAKIIATLVAIAWTWIGNRFWTFRHDRATGQHATREGLEFLGVSLAGMLIGLLPLWLAHYVFGWNSLVVENVANLVGIGLGSIFRFALYRWWVYSPRRLHLQEARAAADAQGSSAAQPVGERAAAARTGASGTPAPAMQAVGVSQRRDRY